MKEYRPTFYTGIIEANNDPLQIGRVRVRVLGVHHPEVSEQPTEDLPWSHVVQIGGAGSGLGFHSVPEIGTWVLCGFLDEDTVQQPVVLGCLNTIHAGSGGGGSNVDADGNPLSGGTASENNQDLGSVEYNGEMIFKPEWFTCLGVSQSNAETLARGYSKWWLKICASQKENYEQMARIIGCNYGESGNFKATRENPNYRKEAFIPGTPFYVNGWSKYANHPKLNEAIAQHRVLDITYANKYGNGGYESGDGMKYRGGGFIQLTFKEAYTRCAKDMGMSGPEELATKIMETDYAIGSSVWFWWKAKGKGSPAFKNSMTESLRAVGNQAGKGQDAKRIAAYQKVRVAQGKN